MCQIAPYRNTFFAILFSSVLASAGWAQGADEPEEEGNNPATQAETTANDESVSDDYASAEPASEELANEEIDVDDGSYIDAEERDFKPSEEIGADQSITFPTDI